MPWKHGTNDRGASPYGGALGGGSAAHGARLPNWRTTQWPNLILLSSREVPTHTSAPSLQRRPKATHKGIKAKAPKRQTRRKSAVRSRGRIKPAAAKTKQQVCLDLLNSPEGATVEELQAATGWQQHSVRGFLAGAVKKKLGLTLLSEKPDAGPRHYRIASAV